MSVVKIVIFKNNRLEITIADRFFKRMRGLLFKSSLKHQQALFITPCASVHTIGMRYAIDVVFLGADYQVLKTVAHCVPMRMASCKRAKHTLELLAGEVERLGIQVGTRFPRIL